MELVYAIADYLGIPNEFIIIEQYINGVVWFRTTAGAAYSCKTVRNGKYLKKNSIRAERGIEPQSEAPHYDQL